MGEGYVVEIEIEPRCEFDWPFVHDSDGSTRPGPASGS